LKVDVMLGPTSGKNWLTCSVPDVDSRSLFHFPHRWRIGHFSRFTRH